MAIYYKKDFFVVRTSVLSDVEYLSENLRRSDIDEIMASHQITPFIALYRGLKESVLCLTIENKGVQVAMFGISPENLIGNSATIWFLSSEELDKIKIKFLRKNRQFIDMFLTIYPYLSNHVDRRNSKSIDWLRWLNANIEDAMPFGVEGLLFHRFSFTKGE